MQNGMPPKRYSFTFIFVFCLSVIQAQDNVLSQFFANRIYLNPAFAGLEKGLQFNSSFRNQWLRTDGGYQFTALAVEWQEPLWNSGFGINVQSANEGIAPLKTRGVGLTYSYVAQLKHNAIHFGIQYAFNQKTIDWSRLTFSDQLDPVFGSVYSTGAPLGLDRLSFHDFGMGVVWRSDSRLIGNKNSLKRFRSHLGLAIQHLGSLFGQGPDESFLQSNTEIPARITLHAGTIIPLVFLAGSSHKIVVSPNFRLETQGFQTLNLKKSLTLFSAGAYFVFEQAIFGVYYNSRSIIPSSKNTNSVTCSIGFTQNEKKEKKQSYYLGLSVDVNANGAGVRSGNVYELNLRYNFRKIRPISEKKHAATTRETVMECKNFY